MMATMRIPESVSPAQIGHARKTIVVDGVVRDVSVPWRGVVQMNTDLAEQLWSMRGGNPRPFSKHFAAKYANDIRAGSWGMVYPSEITVTSDGVLGNGQHRAAAVLACGIPINVEIVLGVDRAALAFMDCGRNRSLDVRKRLTEGSPLENKYAVMIASGLVKIATNHPNVSVNDVAKMDSVYHDSIVCVANRASRIGNKKGVCRIGPLCALSLYHNTDPDGALLFMDSFFAPGGDIQPAVMLRDYMLTHPQQTGGMSVAIEFERANSTINAAMRGENVKLVKRMKEHPCGPIQFTRKRGPELDWSFM